VSIKSPTHSVRQILIKICQHSTTHSRKYLGLDYISKFTTDYVPVEHRIRVTSSLVKRRNVYSQQIYTTTHKKPVST